MSTEPERWWHHAACKNMGRSWFHLGETIGMDSKAKKQARDRAQKAVCGLCPVRDECRQEALENVEIAEVWGGLTEEERQDGWRHWERSKAYRKVPKNCAVCHDRFVARGTKVCCSDECTRERHRQQAREATARKGLGTWHACCPRCGTFEKVVNGECRGWECIRAAKLEAKRRAFGETA